MDSAVKLANSSKSLISHKLSETLRIPHRAEIIEKLEHEEFDLLIVGGGATGSGRNGIQLKLTLFKIFMKLQARHWMLLREV